MLTNEGMAMVETAAVLLAVAGAIVFVMRMDEDPNRWLGSRPRPAGRHRQTDDGTSGTGTGADRAGTDTAAASPARSPAD